MTDAEGTSSPQPTVPEPGWFVDPTGSHAYRSWNGTQWTECTSDSDRPEDLHVPQPTSVISGFWRRSVAFILDTILLGVVGMVVGYLLFDLMANLGPWGRLVGFAASLTYFTSLDSSVGGGQTLGKRLLGIRVVDRAGSTIAPTRAALRYALLAAPAFVNGLLIPATTTRGALGYAISFVLLGLGSASAYLYVFNRRTRQSVHDLAAGSFVTRATSSGEVVATMWRPHLAVAGSLLVIAVIGVTASGIAARRLPDELYRSLAAIEDSGQVHTASIFYGKSRVEGGPIGYVRVNAVMKEPVDNEQAVVEELAAIVIDEWPEAANVDIYVTVSRGFDIGIASGWTSWTSTAGPSDS